jgi:hypothetical protein
LLRQSMYLRWQSISCTLWEGQLSTAVPSLAWRMLQDLLHRAHRTRLILHSQACTAVSTRVAAAPSMSPFLRFVLLVRVNLYRDYLSVTARCSSSFSGRSAFSFNPTQRNLRISMTISLEAVGVCLAGVSMIILSRVLAFIATSFAGLAASNFCCGCVSHHIIAQT